MSNYNIINDENNNVFIKVMKLDNDHTRSIFIYDVRGNLGHDIVYFYGDTTPDLIFPARSILLEGENFIM